MWPRRDEVHHQDTTPTMVNTHEDEIRKDVLRYQQIAKNRKLLSEIPRWGTAHKTQRRPKAAKQRPDKSPKLRRPLFTSKENKDKSDSGKSSSKPLNNAVWSVHTKATSFHDRLSVETNYSLMIEHIRDHADSIDFGLAQKLMPKNLAYERARFDIISHTAPLRQGPSLYSDDIDSFLRSLSQMPVNSPQVPLI